MMTNLETRIGYTFQNPRLLERALTHSSYANERRGRGESNERMEFLGDAVLSLVVADHLFRRFHLPEGELSKIRAGLVCEKTLFVFAREIGLGSDLLLGKGERLTGGSTRPSTVADAFEALIAAVYLDGGLDRAREFILPFVENELEGDGPAPFVDYKTRLQEIVQVNPEESVSYVPVSETGPEHSKRFTVEVHLNSNVIGRGSGRSKKRAEQEAAKEALMLMGEI